MADDDPIGQTTATHPSIDWRDGFPYATDFDDIYFTNDGLAEARHVFLQGNRLAERFASGGHLIIGETGFGTGLNFLAAWDLWTKIEKPAGSTLRFVSCELKPFDIEQLARAHARFGEIETFASRLRSLWPDDPTGTHTIDLSDSVSLQITFDEVLPSLIESDFRADAWFLDGFSPAKNPEMWRQEVMSAVAARSASNATLATFTVAGAVRRALSSAGFTLEKVPGFDRKREMLVGHLTSDSYRVNPPQYRNLKHPWYDHSSIVPLGKNSRVAIIGAGVAGASVANSLRSRGINTTVLDPNGPAHGASGNPAGLIMPRLDVGDTPAARFFKSAYLFALDTIGRLDPNHEFFTPNGVLLKSVDSKDAEKHQKIADTDALEPDQMSLHPDGLLFEKGGVVSPRHYVSALLGLSDVARCSVTQIQVDEADRVTLDIVGEGNSAQSEQYDAVVIANGRDAARFFPTRSMPLSSVAGQIDVLDGLHLDGPAIAAGPYIARGPDGGIIAGATYDKIGPFDDPVISRDATRANIAAARSLGLEVPKEVATRPRVAVRCQTPDRLPVVGPCPDWAFYAARYDNLRFGRQDAYPAARYTKGVFVLTGLGSRGLVTAPFCAEILASIMCGDQPPIDADAVAALHPGRFFIRDYKCARPTKPS
ncbi:MAG: bifunctional tRNA (5-methylaminomethyl-2-thiouridine)(34)-methyltransferase MnmD/FAD-dependent 5-carboxymethylaminomethyl-2-thiouridine(34) oxidoreductase MnmC [Pseudomonadota bacterium]